MAEKIPREQFERRIAFLENSIGAPQAGFFGPHSKVWNLSRDSVIMLGGGRAALMQVAHPYVAHAILSHSSVMTDVQGRFRRTFENVFAMIFGTTEEALQSARRVRRIHEHVSGTIDEEVGRFPEGHPYDALDREATLWVAATLWDTMILVREMLVGPVSPAEKDTFYRESRRFAAMFGLSDEDMPADWQAFRCYVDDMLASDTIAVGEAAREICGYLIHPPRRAATPVYAWLEVFTAGILPRELRRAFGFSWRPIDQFLFRASVHAIEGLLPALPESLRYFPAYLDAVRRLAGRGPDPVANALEQFVLSGLREVEA